MVTVWKHPYSDSKELETLTKILAVFGVTAKYE